MMTRAEALALLCTRLAPDEVEQIKQLLVDGPKPSAFRRRLKERDALIRELASCFPGPRKHRAKEIEKAWVDYVTRIYPRDRHHPQDDKASHLRKLLRRLADCAGPRTLGRDQIENVLDGSRGRGRGNKSDVDVACGRDSGCRDQP